MRIWGRLYAEDGTWTWVAVSTDANGNNDNVYITNLIQALKLNLGESPFYAQYGIPAERSVITQVPPDFFALRTQSQFSGFFASLILQKQQGVIDPTYDITCVTQQGTVIATNSADVPT